MSIYINSSHGANCTEEMRSGMRRRKPGLIRVHTSKIVFRPSLALAIYLLDCDLAMGLKLNRSTILRLTAMK
jgi:hypothetical protein